ncbi:phosphotransferase family protein [Bacillus sp. Marseille-Q1617]|uniref:phosphotransferase family protein n=1 Tax=Bacillus sp. Marseille-Q1617 TaxID=2736887 RepID=UPI001589184C|nr:aminoglycoside phosphotransferase family protein [Bacillus sp. Marseille-Q1617]
MSKIVDIFISEVTKDCEHLCSLVSIHPFASGVENCVLIGQTLEWGKVVIRVPWDTMSRNQTKKSASRAGLEKEYKLTTFSYQHHLPAPIIYLFHQGKEVDFIIQEYVSGDKENAAPLNEMGKFVKVLHQIEVPPQFLRDAHEAISERLIKNAKEFNLIFNPTLSLPHVEELKEIFESYPSKSRLLHMDIRPENILFRNKKVVGIFDWTNSLAGDPVLELMRIKEYGFLGSEFIEGYHEFESEIQRVPEMVRWLYQLDTSLMLILLFKELGETEQERRSLVSLKALYNKIKKAS